MFFYTTSTFRETLAALTKKSKNNQLHQVDITNGLAEISQNGCLPGDKHD